jgi:uncharacterized protein (DUF1778 family)
MPKRAIANGAVAESDRVNVSISRKTHNLIEKVTDITGQKISRFSDMALHSAASEEAKRLKALGHKIAA